MPQLHEQVHLHNQHQIFNRGPILFSMYVSKSCIVLKTRVMDIYASQSRRQSTSWELPLKGYSFLWKCLLRVLLVGIVILNLNIPFATSKWGISYLCLLPTLYIVWEDGLAIWATFLLWTFPFLPLNYDIFYTQTTLIKDWQWGDEPWNWLKLNTTRKLTLLYINQHRVIK